MAAPARVAPARRHAPRRPPARRPARKPGPSQRHLRVVRPMPPRRRRRLTLTIAVFVTLVAVFGVVAFNAFLVQSQFRLERMEEQLDAERQEFERLRLESARLSSPERVLDIARRELGMGDPEAVTNLTAPASGEPIDGAGSGAAAWAEVKPHLASEP